MKCAGDRTQMGEVAAEGDAVDVGDGGVDQDGAHDRARLALHPPLSECARIGVSTHRVIHVQQIAQDRLAIGSR